MVQIVPPEGWQPGGTGEASAAPTVAAIAAAAKPVRPPPLVRAKVPTPELTSEAVEAAVAGVGPMPNTPPSAPQPVLAGNAGSSGLPAGRISARTLWLGAGAAGIAVVSALLAVLIGAAQNTPDPVVAAVEAKQPDSPPAAEKLPVPNKAAPVAETPAPSAAEKSNIERPAVDKTNVEKPAIEPPPAVAPTPPTPPDSKLASPDEKPAPAPPSPPVENSPPKAVPIVDNKPDVDENLDPVERSASFAFRRGREAIDWPSRLNQPLAGLDCRELPLADFAELMAALGNAPLSLDVDTLAELGVSPAAPLTLHLGNTTFSSALDAGLAPRGLRAVVEGNHLLLTRAGENAAPLRSVPYGVRDLATDAAALAELADAIRTLIAPDSWKEAGGVGTIRIAEKSLVIEQTPSAHYQIVLLCEKLRVARGLPPKTQLDPATFRLEPRTDRAQAKLAMPVSGVFFRPTPLPKVLDYLAKQTQTRLLVDYRALEFEGIAPDVAGTISAKELPLAAALTSLLEPLQLAYRVVDDKTLQITPQRGFRRELEAYRVAELLARGVRPEQIMDRLAKEVAPGRWAISGGKGAMHFDRVSGCLLVSHSQLVQRDVQTLLSRWRPGHVNGQTTAAR